MRIAFLTEMGFQGKIPSNHPNMRTEFAWMHALDADHHNIHQYETVTGYDHIFIIFPKGEVFLNAVGSRLVEKLNPTTDLLASNIVPKLKSLNQKVHYVQEGPHWLYTDYELQDQINFYNLIASCDSVFTHNESDTQYYKGLFPGKIVNTIPTLMIETLIQDTVPTKEDKVIIGGNFARWYGGFESFIVAQEFQVPIWGQTSHATRNGEEQLIKHLPRVLWVDWMKQLSSFKFAVHLMPTVAAGTFSLNCAYLGIPVIGNQDVDTQRICHPELSVKVSDVQKARELAKRLQEDQDFYDKCSGEAKENYRKYYDLELFKQKINTILSR